SAAEMNNLATLVNNKYSSIRGCFGFVDGVRIRVLPPKDPDEAKTYYNNKVRFPSINNVFVFQADGVICWANINVPGAAHDIMLCNSLFHQLRTRTGRGFYILGDKGFIVTKNVKSAA